MVAPYYPRIHGHILVETVDIAPVEALAIVADNHKRHHLAHEHCAESVILTRSILAIIRTRPQFLAGFSLRRRQHKCRA
jgi:hypothetical protein